MDQTIYRELISKSGECGYSPALIEAIRNELEKILCSRTFHAAEGQRAFLKYTVEQAVAGRGHILKEYVIGTEALGRGASFDPRLDPIVRTQARKLRARLAKYYEAEGQEDEVQIEFPKGSYCPCFQRAEQPVLCAAPPTPASFAEPNPLLAPVRASRRFVTVALAIVLILGLSAATVYLRRPAWARSTVASDYASIAIMPLVNLGEAPGEEFLSDGLSDELIQSLRAVPGLQVVAHPSKLIKDSMSARC